MADLTEGGGKGRRERKEEGGRDRSQYSHNRGRREGGKEETVA